MTPQSIGTGEDRGWQTDSELGDKTLRKTDWEKANPVRGYEMGHIAPLADFTGLPKSKWSQANILSNITPQCGTFNNGRWKWLEEAERALVRMARSPVYIVAGPLYIGDMPKLPNSERNHVVPSAFWKVIGLKNGSKLRSPPSKWTNMSSPTAASASEVPCRSAGITASTWFLSKMSRSISESEGRRRRRSSEKGESNRECSEARAGDWLR